MRIPVWLVAAVLVLSGCGTLGAEPVAPAPGSPGRAEVAALLDRVRVVPARDRPGGYERGCRPGQACVFGPAWTDDTDAPGGHDGCDTRNNVLAAQLTEVTHRGGCVVVGGRLADPYTGRRIEFTKAEAGRVQIDHVYPLAAAWDLGAAEWPAAKRRRFANDLSVNLLAVDGPTNQAKGDRTPADWLPPDPSRHCFYAAKYLTAALDYDLPVTDADHRALTRIVAGCA